MSSLTSVKYLPCTEPCFKESEMSAVPPSGVERTVSVVIPLYNTEKYVAECIGSVLDQTLRDLEVLVVDDGSQDRSAEIVKQIARRDDRVRLLRHPGGVNLGVSRTRRLGITEASGEYIAYLDADDAFEPTKLDAGQSDEGSPRLPSLPHGSQRDDDPARGQGVLELT